MTGALAVALILLAALLAVVQLGRRGWDDLTAWAVLAVAGALLLARL